MKNLLIGFILILFSICCSKSENSNNLAVDNIEFNLRGKSFIGKPVKSGLQDNVFYGYGSGSVKFNKNETSLQFLAPGNDVIRSYNYIISSNVIIMESYEFNGTGNIFTISGNQHWLSWGSTLFKDENIPW